MVNDHPSQDTHVRNALSCVFSSFIFVASTLRKKEKNTKSVGTSGLRICHGQNMVYGIGYDHPTIIRDFLQWDVLGMLTPMNILLLEDDHHLSWENKPTFHISHWSFWALYPFTPKQLAQTLNVPSISSTASYTTIHGFVWRIGYLGFQRKIKKHVPSTWQ